jgi:hypothetical protein
MTTTTPPQVVQNYIDVVILQGINLAILLFVAFRAALQSPTTVPTKKQA